MKTLLIIVLMLLTACNTDSRTDSGSLATNKNERNITKTDISNSDSSNEMQNDSTILIKFQKDSSSTFVKAKMKGIRFPITVYIPVKRGKELTAKITPEDSVANIRFNQILLPNGKADGPFGRDLKYPINQQGTYKLIVAENKMQGDEWKGNFLLTVSVK